MKGFKNTEVGLIPEDWDGKLLGSISNSVASGKSKTQSDFGGKYFIYGSTGVIGQCIKPDYSGEKILVARVGANAGTVNQVNGEYSVSDNTLMVQLKRDVDFNYIFYFLRYSNLNKLIFGSGQPLITGTQLSNLLIPLPPTLAEQTAIATALNDADALIQKLEQLIAKKRLIKQGAMQELLRPKEGWEVKRIRDISLVGRGRVISHKEISKSINAKYPVYSSQTQNNGIMGYIDTYDFDGEYLTWTTDGIYAGKVFYRNGKFNYTNVCGTIKLKKDNRGLFHIF